MSSVISAIPRPSVKQVTSVKIGWGFFQKPFVRILTNLGIMNIWAVHIYSDEQSWAVWMTIFPILNDEQMSYQNFMGNFATASAAVIHLNRQNSGDLAMADFLGWLGDEKGNVLGDVKIYPPKLSCT